MSSKVKSASCLFDLVSHTKGGQMSVLNRVKFKVSMALLRNALAMPDYAVIYNIIRESADNVFTFYVEHSDLPAVPLSEPTPEVTPVFTADYDKRPSTWIEFDWGV